MLGGNSSVDVRLAGRIRAHSLSRKREPTTAIAEPASRIPGLRRGERPIGNPRTRGMRYRLSKARERRTMSLVEKPGTSSITRT